MYHIFIQGTDKTPTINFIPEKSVLEIVGNSIPENAYEFYLPLFQWVEIIEENPPEKMIIEFKLEYFNTSSSKCILDFFKRINELFVKKKYNISVKWYYDYQDEDMRDIGKEFQSMLKVPFELIKHHFE